MSDFAAAKKTEIRSIVAPKPVPPTESARQDGEAGPGNAAGARQNGNRPLPAGWRRGLPSRSWRPGKFEDAF